MSGFYPSLLEPSRGLISKETARLTSNTVTEIGFKDKKYKLDDFFELLNNEEIINGIVELKALRASLTIGRYTHANKFIQDWVNGVFDDMEGTLQDLASKLSIATFFGFSVAEIEWKAATPGFKREWRLKKINPLSIKNIRFAGTKKGVTHVVDKSRTHVKTDPITKLPSNYIPIQKCLHLSRGAYDGDPYGVGLARRAMPYWKAKKTLLSHWVVAGKNMANGMLIGYADSTQTVQVLDKNGRHLKRPDGQPMTINAVENLLKQIEKLDEHSCIATDKQNQVQWMPMSVNDGFFQGALNYIDRKLHITQLAPTMTFEEGSSQFGNTGVMFIQKTMLDSQLEALMRQLKDQIIENIVRPLLVWNFGWTAKQGWGDFTIESSQDPQTQMGKAQMLMQVLGSQLIPSTDNTAMNTLRELIGLPKQNEDEMLAEMRRQIEYQAMQQQMMQQMQASQQQQTPVSGKGGEPPNTQPGQQPEANNANMGYSFDYFPYP